MKLFYTFILLTLFLGYNPSFGQTVSKVSAERNQGGVLSINYNLEDARDNICKYFVQVYYLDINSKWVEITENITGDIGMNQNSGFKKSIKWNPFLNSSFS
jgi:hypothetical protein